jgi:hypothetical protein
VLAGVCLTTSLSLSLNSAVGEEQTNPHWNKAACQTCHVDSAPTAANLVFQESDPNVLCESCHEGRGDAKSCRHSSGIPPRDMSIPETHAASLKGGKIVCTTCHDLAVQCLQPHPAYRSGNPGFVRGRETRDRSDACFACHDKTPVEQLNPHQMEAGDPPQPTCTFCHASMPVKDENGWVSVDFHVEGGLNDICFGCHRVRPHPGFFFSGPVGWEHLGVPSREIVDNMERAEVAQGFKFPIDPSSGEIHCATCHNPHDELLEDYAVARTPGEENRLRVADNCQACHDL